MKRTWLLFAQAVTVMLAAYFVVATLKPEWLGRRATSLGGVVSVIEAPAANPTAIAPGSLSAAAKKASPAVVSINTSKAARRSPRSEDPWFRFFFGDQGADQPQVGLGSGVIVSPDGYILTNNHVVEGADEIDVTLNDSRHARGKVIGTDPDTDLAVLKIELDKLPVIVLGNSDNLQVGDQVLAIGNPFGVGQTVTSGIVSALGRNQLGINTFENFIQTDAAINPGNSGGALIDVNGNLRASTPRSTRAPAAAWASASRSRSRRPSRCWKTSSRTARSRAAGSAWSPTTSRPSWRRPSASRRARACIITGVLQNGPAGPGRHPPRRRDHRRRRARTIDNVQELLTAVAGAQARQCGALCAAARQRQDGARTSRRRPRPRTPIRRTPGEPE